MAKDCMEHYLFEMYVRPLRDNAIWLKADGCPGCRLLAAVKKVGELD